MLRQPPNFKDALATLRSHQVDFIVVGGVAAVLGGAPISTFDLDIVHERSTANVGRLVIALTALDARYRDPAGRVLRPTADGLAGLGHHLLLTRCGPLDVLGRIGRDRGYPELIADSVVRPLGETSINVLGLEALIRSKVEAGRAKDLAVIAILQRTLEESGR